MKISVIFTGGTIGSKTEDTTVSLGTAPYTLLEGQGYDGVSFDCFEPYTVLSEEMTADRLRTLADSVRGHLDSCDGIIVSHGTDSLVYSAAFLGYLFADTPVPIVLVSSGYPLDDPRANGRQNFSAAVGLIRSGEKGVFVTWTADGVSKVHRGVRLLRQLPYTDMLTSLSGGSTQGVPMPCPDDLSGFGRTVYLTVQPSMWYPKLDESVSAVLMVSYHSGTLCADERFAAFMKSADKLGIPVFIAGAGGRDADYETVRKYRDLGAVPLPMASPDAMYVKLCLAASLASDAEGIRKTMLTGFAGDFAE